MTKQIPCPTHGNTKCGCSAKYKLISAINSLPSFALIAQFDIAISRSQVIGLVNKFLDDYYEGRK